MSQSIANEIQIESRERRPLRLDDILMNRWFLHTVSVSLFLGLWYWTVYMGVFGRGLCYPHEVLQEIGNLMTRRLAGKGLWDHAWDSTRRVFIGFGIACALGIPLGFFMGINKYFNAFFNPIFNLIKPMPPISWVPFPSCGSASVRSRRYSSSPSARSCPSCSTPTTASGSSTRNCMMWSAWRAEAA